MDATTALSTSNATASVALRAGERAGGRCGAHVWLNQQQPVAQPRQGALVRLPAPSRGAHGSQRGQFALAAAVGDEQMLLSMMLDPGRQGVEGFAGARLQSKPALVR